MASNPSQMCAFLPFFLLLGGSGTFLPSTDQAAADELNIQKQTFSFSATNQSIFASLIQLGVVEHIPMSIEIYDDSLCRQTKTVAFSSVPLNRILDNLLKGSGSHWSFQEGVLAVRPLRESLADERILNLRFKSFTGIPTTIQGLGIVLSGNITDTLFPSGGFAGNIMSSSEAETVTLSSPLRNASVETIANAIVKLGHHGVWILYGVYDKGDDPKALGRVTLRTYGYRDDASFLEHLGCSH